MGRKKKTQNKTQVTLPMRALLAAHVSVLTGAGLSLRTANKLEQHGICTVDDLLHCCPRPADECTRGFLQMPCDNQHVMDIPNFGKSSMEEVFDSLAQHGFTRYSNAS